MVIEERIRDKKLKCGINKEPISAFSFSRNILS